MEVLINDIEMYDNDPTPLEDILKKNICAQYENDDYYFIDVFIDPYCAGVMYAIKKDTKQVYWGYPLEFLVTIANHLIEPITKEQLLEALQ